tara:strand:+ start:466 stop:807 length:342 start_codon:yes stop_codon:yes gene_type:complete
MAIYSNSEIRINLNELVEIRQTCVDIDLTDDEVEEIAADLLKTLTWDNLYYMVDSAILNHKGLTTVGYGSTAGNEPAASFEKEQKEREKYFKDNFKMITLDGGSWKIDVPMRK